MGNLKVGDKAKVLKDFYFYGDYFEKGEIITMQEGFVNHGFEKFVEKIK